MGGGGQATRMARCSRGRARVCARARQGHRTQAHNSFGRARRARTAAPARVRARHLVDLDLDGVHRRVADLVVGRVDQDFVEDLVQPRRVRDALVHHALAVVDPQWLHLLLGGADVCVGAQQDVLQLRHLLIDVFDRLARVVALGPRGVARRQRLGLAAAAAGRGLLGLEWRPGGGG